MQIKATWIGYISEEILEKPFSVNWCLSLHVFQKHLKGTLNVYVIFGLNTLIFSGRISSYIWKNKKVYSWESTTELLVVISPFDTAFDSQQAFL